MHYKKSNPTQVMKYAIILTLLILLCNSQRAVYAAEQLYTLQPTVTPALAEPGKYPVGVKTEKIVHAEQLLVNSLPQRGDRELTVEIWYPATIADADRARLNKASYNNITRAGGQFSLAGEAYRDVSFSAQGRYPLVVLSHGYTGYRSIMFYLGEHLASHGYVVVGIDHTDSTNQEIDFEQAPSAGFLSTLVNRARDQQFVLDYYSGEQNAFAKVIDTQRSAIIGYSMGGYGALNTVGGCFDFGSEFLQSMGIAQENHAAMKALLNTCNGGHEQTDPRWKAMIALAPWGGEQNVHRVDSLAAIDVPSMLMVGELDDISGFEQGVNKLFQRIGAKHKYLLVFENARHNIAAHPAPQIAYGNDLAIGHYFEPAWNIETINRINEHFVLAFLDCHVQKDAEACDHLPTRTTATQVKQADGTLTDPWPGFKNRWATGMLFHRASGVTRPAMTGSCEEQTTDGTCLDEAD